MARMTAARGSAAAKAVGVKATRSSSKVHNESEDTAKASQTTEATTATATTTTTETTTAEDRSQTPALGPGMRKSSRTRKEPERFVALVATGKENDAGQGQATKRRKVDRPPLAGRQADQVDEAERASDEGEAEANLESDSDPDPASDNGSDKDEAFQEATRPAVARGEKQRKRQAKPVKKSRVASLQPTSVNSLYDLVASKAPLSPAQADSRAAEWAQSYLSASQRFKHSTDRPFSTVAEDEAHSRAWADFINLILKASGCANQVQWEDVMDLDRVVETVSEIQSDLKPDDQPVVAAQYPLVNKGKALKKFKSNFAAFLRAWCLQAAEAEILYEESFLEVAQSWLSTLSTSGLRNFRHTATFAALCIESALAEVWRDTISARESAAKQLQNEAGRARVNQARTKTLEEQLANHSRIEDLVHGFVDDWFSTIFLHRYRDVEHSIRSDCILALTNWFETLPEQFLTNDYLKYAGWTLSDKAASVRLHAVQAVEIALTKGGEQANAQQLRQFIDRFKARLLEIAQRDVDDAVRVASIGLLQTLGQAGYLTDALQSKLHLLIFDKNAAVREAVANAVARHLNGQARELAATYKIAEKDSELCILHALTKWLLKSQAQIDTAEGVTSSASQPAGGLASDGRLAAAVQALWSAVPVLNDIKTICRYTLLDHTSPQMKKELKGLQLSPPEETVLLEILLGAVLQVSRSASSEEGTLDQFQSQAHQLKLVELALSIEQLHAKHQTYPDRLLLVIQMTPPVLARITTDALSQEVMRSLWTIASRHFLSTAEPALVEAAGASVYVLTQAGEITGSDLAFERMHEIYQHIKESIQTATHAGDGLDISAIEEEDLEALRGALHRLVSLARRSDVHALFEDSAEGHATPIFEVLSAIIMNAGQIEAIELVRSSIEATFLYFTWRFLSIASDSNPLDEDEKRALNDRKKGYIDLLRKTMTEIDDSTIVGIAYQQLALMLELLASDFISSDDHPSSRAARFLRYSVPSSLQTDLSEQIAKELTKLARQPPVQRAATLKDPQLLTSVATYGRLLCKGVLDLSLATPLFDVVTRLDEPLLEKMVIEVRDCLKDSGLALSQPESTRNLIVDVLTTACKAHLADATSCSLELIVKVSRLLAGLTVAYGAGLKIIERLEGAQMVSVHTTLLDLIIASIPPASGKPSPNHAQPLTLFKVLIPLVAGLHLNDALRVKAHLDSLLAAKALKPRLLGSDKSWDSYHSYIKRFDGIVSKSGLAIEGALPLGKKKEQPKARAAPRLLEDLDDPIDSFEPVSELSAVSGDGIPAV